jgi:hypothetical protein
MASTKPYPVVLLATLTAIAVLGATGIANRGTDSANPARGQGQPRDGALAQRRFVFERPPADLDQVAALIPRGNVNAVAGGHVRPVNHTYVQYLVPHDGGNVALDVNAMAPGEIVMVFHRQSEACVVPDHTVPSDCATGPGSTAMIDEYQVFTRHTDELASNFDHLHSLDAGLGLPDWRDDTAGWVRVGPMDILVLGANGAMAPVRVHPGQRMGDTRNYFTTWDIGVIDTRRRGNFLGTGVLRYPTLPEFFAALAASGVAVDPLGSDQPFAGEMFVNSACFIDYLVPALADAWRAKLVGDGSCGRPDWDAAGTLQGNWYRADVTDPTLANMFAIEENAVSFSPYNLDPANQAKFGFGENFFAMAPPAVPATVLAAARERLDHGLLVTTDRTPGTRHNPDPLTVPDGDYACYDAPDRQSGPGHPLPVHSVVVYLQADAGSSVHLRLKYFPTSCTNRLAFYAADLARLASETWWGDYVR